MARTPREQNILTVLPALLVLIVYLFSFNRGEELSQAQLALNSARQAQVSPLTVDAERQVIQTKTTEHDALKQQIAKLLEQKSALVEHQQREPGDRANAMRRVTKILWDNGLTTITEAPVEGATGQLPEGVQAALRRLAAANPALSSTPSVDPRLAAQQTAAPNPAANLNAGQNAQLWEVKFYGKYSNVLSALERLAKTTEAAVPVGLKMDKTHPAADGWRVWTLVLWL
ncbi:MAG: hypothetical protein JNM18_01255 [Planctomycetaceae bacterium]|nr:hypothetical protein [Planctomycetaceae bacterium]